MDEGQKIKEQSNEAQKQLITNGTLSGNEIIDSGIEPSKEPEKFREDESKSDVDDKTTSDTGLLKNNNDQIAKTEDMSISDESTDITTESEGLVSDDVPIDKDQDDSGKNDVKEIESSNKQEDRNFDELLNKTPYISNEVYEHLPPFMRNACNIFTDPRERDVFFTSFLVVLSGCLGETSAYYSKDKIYPNLYGFVIAPAGSNKSSAKYSKTICMKVHNIILNTEEDEVSDSPSKSKMKKQKVVKLLFIPANSSVARIYEHLDSGVPSSILFETEADTLGDTFKMEWGNFSDIIRKLFHHETISYSRKMDNQYIEIEKARLSIFLSGTVNQIHKIIPNSENGLFSRFIFYMYRSEQVWRSPRPNPDNKGYDEQMEALSDKALEMYHFLNEYPTEVSWTDEQWDKFDETYEARLKDIDLYTEGEDAASIVKRLGMITYRITMILTAVYKYEQLDKKKDITCSDAHFNIALKMTDTFFLHSLSLYNYMSNAKEYKVSKTKQMQLLDSLEPVFTVRDVKAKLDFYGVSQRTMQRVIKMKREKGDLKKIDKSTFEKVLKK